MGYFSVIFAVFVSNLAFGLSEGVDGLALAVSCILLACMFICGTGILCLKYRGKIKSVYTVPALYLTLSLIVLISNINTINVLQGEDPMSVAPPIFIFVGLIIVSLPLACEYVYTRTLGSNLLILVFTTIV